MRLPWLLASFCGLVLIVLGACGGSNNLTLDAPTTKATYVPQRSVPPAATIGAADGVSWCVRNVCSVTTNPPPTATASPVPTPVSLPGEGCPPVDTDRKQTGVYIFDLMTCELGRFNSDPSDGDVVWSPDGSRLAFVRFTAPLSEAGSNVFVLDLQTGLETQVSFAPDERKDSLTWSPDGSKLAFYMRSYTGHGPSENFGLWVLDLATSKQKLILPDSVHGYCLYAWSPDSKAIAAGCTHGPLFWIDVASGERRDLDEQHGFGDPAWSPDGEMIAYSCETDSRGPYYACAIRADGSGRVMFPDSGGGGIWSFSGDRVVFSDGNTLFVGDPSTGNYTRVTEDWAGGEPRAFLSERVLVGFACSPNVAPCNGHQLLTDIDAGKTIEAIVGPGSRWSPNRRYIAFAIGDTGAHPL